MKSFLNNPSNAVAQSLEGLLVDDNLALLDRFPQIKVVVRRHWEKNKVALITGGGSGHQPAHAGFIGTGMLTAVVCGQIFASPSVDAVLSAILAVTGQSGCLLIVKNYTGDRLNFGLAAQQARALGFKVQMVIVGDDISIPETTRKRGIAGTLFVHKIAGFYAEQGKSLEQVTKIAERVTKCIFSIGLCIRQHTMFSGSKKQRLNDQQAELGLGIHGQPGKKVIQFGEADQLINLTVKQLQPYLSHDKNYALMLNNLGFVTPIQMNILMNSLRKTFLTKFVKYVQGPNHFMTALNMTGFSLSLVQLNEESTPALLAEVNVQAWGKMRQFVEPTKIKSPELPTVFSYKPSQNVKTKIIIQKIVNVLIKSQNEINAMDSIVGDGDTGSTLASISKKIISNSDKLPYDNIKQLLQCIGKMLAREGGGSIGVLLSIMFLASSTAYNQYHHLGKSLLFGLGKMQQYGGATKNGRTMIDALLPGFEGLSKDLDLKQICKNVRQGAEGTKKIRKTQFGRSAYVPGQKLEGSVDPGAEAVARVFEQLGI